MLMPFIYLSAVIFSTFLLFISLFYLACLKIYNNNKEWKFEFETDTRFPLVLHNCSRNIKITKTNVKMWKLKDKATDRTQDKEVPIVICREREREKATSLLPSSVSPEPHHILLSVDTNPSLPRFWSISPSQRTSRPFDGCGGRF